MDKCNIHRINRPLIQDLEWNVQCEMFAILYSCTLREGEMQGRGQLDENRTLGQVETDSWGGLGREGLLSINKYHLLRIMQHVARIMYRMCINILINTGLLSYA